MTPSDTYSASSSVAAWLAVPLGASPTLSAGDGVLAVAITDVPTAAIASGVLAGLLALIAALLRGGRQSARAAVPVRARDRRGARR
jgi:hypothetical protein